MKVARLRQIFDVERRRFARVYPWVESTWLQIESTHIIPNPCARDLAWYDPDFMCVHVMRSILKRPEGTVRGVVRHELGHAADATLGTPGRERRADRIVLRVTGKPILYDEEGLQSTTRGKPGRPRWLHQ